MARTPPAIAKVNAPTIAAPRGLAVKPALLLRVPIDLVGDPLVPFEHFHLSYLPSTIFWKFVALSTQGKSGVQTRPLDSKPLANFVWFAM